MVLHEYYCWPVDCKDSRLLHCRGSVNWKKKTQILDNQNNDVKTKKKEKGLEEENLNILVGLVQECCMMLHIFSRDVI